jgi:hypothetical protein
MPGSQHHTSDQFSIDKSIGSLPEKYLELKKEIAKGLDPEVLIKSWREVLEGLEKMTNESAKLGPEVRLYSDLRINTLEAKARC